MSEKPRFRNKQDVARDMERVAIIDGVSDLKRYKKRGRIDDWIEFDEEAETGK